MYAFDYHAPGSLDAALALLREREDAKLVAGGMTLLPTMKLRLAGPSDLVDLAGIPGLDGIAAGAETLRIGAMTRHADVAESTEVRQAIPALAALAACIGDPQVRNRGTLGGSIANADPAADYPAALLGLGATVTTDRRSIPADAFFTGLFETALAEDEIVKSVEFPVPDAAAYAKFPNPASRYAIVGVMVARFGDAVRVAVTGAGPAAFRVPEMETALAARFAPEALEGMTVDDATLNDDLHASAAYRAHLVGVMARRATAAAA